MAREMGGIEAIYLNGMMRSMVLALVGIFTPVYLYQLGINWFGDSSLSIMLAAGYLLSVRLVSLLAVITVSKIIARIGFRRSIALSLVLLVLNLALLILAPKGIGLVVLAAVAAGLNIPFYWVSRSSAVTQDGDGKRIGRQVSSITVAEQIGGMLGPVSAGLIITTWGYPALYTLAILILFVSIIPVWYMTPHVHKNSASLKGFWQYATNRRFFHNAVGAAGKAVDDYAVTALWPLSIIVMGISTTLLGGLFSLTALLSIGVRLVGGKVFDSLHKRRDLSDEILYAVSASAVSIIWGLRLFARSIGSILAIDLSGALFGTTYSSTYLNYEFLGGMRMGNIAYWVYQEMVYSLATIWIMTLAIVGAWLGIWRELVFLSASLWVLTSMVMARESNIK